MIYLIILAIAGFFAFPVYRVLETMGTIGSLLTMVMGLGIGWCMCKLSDNSYGIFKILAYAILFIALVGYLGIVGWLIAIIIAAIW